MGCGRIQSIDKKLFDDSDGFLPSDMVEMRKDLLANMEFILRCEDIHWNQKAKCKWIKEGNKNTKFFHRVANGKRRKSIISKLYIEGELVEDMEKIKEETICYYLKLYSKERESSLH